MLLDYLLLFDDMPTPPILILAGEHVITYEPAPGLLTTEKHSGLLVLASHIGITEAALQNFIVEELSSFETGEPTTAVSRGASNSIETGQA